MLKGFLFFYNPGCFFYHVFATIFGSESFFLSYLTPPSAVEYNVEWSNNQNKNIFPDGSEINTKKILDINGPLVAQYSDVP